MQTYYSLITDQNYFVSKISVCWMRYLHIHNCLVFNVQKLEYWCLILVKHKFHNSFFIVLVHLLFLM